MKRNLQDKFQVIMPSKPQKNEWAELKNNQRKCVVTDSNEMPSINRENQSGNVDRFVPISLAGEHSVTDHVSSSLKKGYTRGVMNPSDDQYTGEAIDMFYGEVEGDDGVGFCERNNYLDRI
jgi:hypothetical protein